MIAGKHHNLSEIVAKESELVKKIAEVYFSVNEIGYCYY